MTSSTPRRRTRLAVVAGAAAVVLVVAGAWAVSAGVLPEVAQPFSTTEGAEYSARITTIASAVQTDFLVSAPDASAPATTPDREAAALAAQVDLSAEATRDVAAYATRTERLRADLAEGTTRVDGTSVVIDSIAASRRWGGPELVCARVHSTYRFTSGIPGEDVVPWLLTVDPDSRQITALEVQDWDDGGYAC